MQIRPEFALTESRVIINPWTAELHEETDEDNPFKGIPSSHYQALFWGVATEHPNVPYAHDQAKINECLRGLRVQPGKLPNGWLRELYDDFFKSGGSGWKLPHLVSRLDAQVHIETHLRTRVGN